MKMLIQLSLLALTFALFGCATQSSRPTEIDKLRQADSALESAVESKDLERTVSFYASDSSILPVAEPLITGIDAIRDEWKHLFAIPNFANKAVLTKIEVSGDGTLGYTQGTYATVLGVGEGKTETEHGKWVTVWKKQSDGTWKIAVDVYNSDSRPPDHL